MDPKLVSIIIVTRNRPQTLKRCLTITRQHLPAEIQIIVFDDASADTESVCEIIGSFPNTVRIRTETSVGPGEGRNRCVNASTTPFALSIDDDCYLDYVPDLSRWLASRPEDHDIAVVGFRVCNLPGMDLAPAGREEGEARSFLGGASLLRREAMLRSGGYLEWIGFAAEESELAMRLVDLGYRIWYDPSVVIPHDRNSEGRDWYLGSLYYVRNTFVINMIHGGCISGLPLAIIRALRRGLRSDRPSATLEGLWGGIRLIPRCFRARKELFLEERRYLNEATSK